MKVTFLIPPVLDNTKDVDRCFGCNYGLYFLPLLPVLYSATLLKDEVEDLSILDFAATKKKESDFRDFIGNDNSDCYIFYSVFLSQKTDLIAREMIRKIRPGAKFIFAGPQATFAPEVFLDREETWVIRGEPEFISLDLIRALKSGSDLSALKGISYLKDFTIKHNPSRELLMDLDEIPIPDRGLIDHRPYHNPKLSKNPHSAIITSRGCYAQCWYCVPGSLAYAQELEYKKFHGKKPPPRLHSVKRVIEEFCDIARRGFRSVSVIDDEFLWSEERTVAICEGIKDLGLEWFCLARPDKITEKSAQAMAQAGCSCIDMGTESFDEGVLRAIRKGMSPEDTKRAVRILKKNNIQAELNILFGATPQETESTIKKTLKEVKKLDVDYVLFGVANPFPGTDFFSAAKEQGWLYYGDYVPTDPARDAIISYPHLSKKRLEWLLAYAYLSFYFNPRYLINQIFKIKGMSDLKNKLKTGIRFIGRNFLKR